jgi:hypothetical protein
LLALIKHAQLAAGEALAQPDDIEQPVDSRGPPAVTPSVSAWPPHGSLKSGTTRGPVESTKARR